MAKTKFVYVIYISSTQEKIWKALLDGEMTKQYWGHENFSDWKPGSMWQHRKFDDAHTVMIAGEVVEFSPPKRLVMTWAFAEEVKDKSKHSRVAIDLEPLGDMVRLTVVHDELEPESNMLHGISEGWPRVLSSLKSFLETGKPLNTWVGKK